MQPSTRGDAPELEWKNGTTSPPPPPPKEREAQSERERRTTDPALAKHGTAKETGHKTQDTRLEERLEGEVLGVSTYLPIGMAWQDTQGSQRLPSQEERGEEEKRRGRDSPHRYRTTDKD